jgi:hypothetical protein
MVAQQFHALRIYSESSTTPLNQLQTYWNNYIFLEGLLGLQAELNVKSWNFANIYGLAPSTTKDISEISLCGGAKE